MTNTERRKREEVQSERNGVKRIDNETNNNQLTLCVLLPLVEYAS